MVRIILISVLIGATIGALIPNRPELLGRVQIFVILSLLWLFLSLLVHLTCRLFGGKEGVGTTVTLMMQALAFAYVVSNFLTLLAAFAYKFYGPLIPESCSISSRSRPACSYWGCSSYCCSISYP